MKQGHTVSLLIVLIFGAFLAIERSSAVEAEHHETEATHAGAHSHAAMTDMLHHANKHLAGATPHVHSFHLAHGWMTGWALHWMDFEHDGRIVRIYHATHAEHPHVRYVAVADPHGHHTRGWTQVH